MRGASSRIGARLRECGDAGVPALRRDEGREEAAESAMEAVRVEPRELGAERGRPASQVIAEEEARGAARRLPRRLVSERERVRLLPREHEQELALAGDMVGPLARVRAHAEAEGPEERAEVAHLALRLEEGVLTVLGLVGRRLAPRGVAEEAPVRCAERPERRRRLDGERSHERLERRSVGRVQHRRGLGQCARGLARHQPRDRLLRRRPKSERQRFPQRTPTQREIRRFERRLRSS